jgi:hypothetical protein
VINAVDLEAQTFSATLTVTASQGTESPSAVVTTVTASNSASRPIVATLTVTPTPEQEQPTASEEATLPSLVTTIVTAVDSQSCTVLPMSVYTIIVVTDDQSTALTTVITAVDLASRTVLTTLTLVTSSTSNIGDLVCSGIGGCATATRSAPPGEFTGAAKRKRHASGLVDSVVVGLLGIVIAIV